MEQLGLVAGERVCFVGVGTGADLLHVPKGVTGIGVDLSEAMLTRAEKKLPIGGCDIELRVGDAQALPLDDGVFDAVVLNLILSVVPDPARCMAEAIRVLRPGGRIVIFDKFLPGQGGEGVRWSDEKGGPEPLPFPSDGSPFEGFRWRSDERLKINFLWVLLYITKAPQDYVSKVWFDNIVVAKEYIGPLTP